MSKQTKALRLLVPLNLVLLYLPGYSYYYYHYFVSETHARRNVRAPLARVSHPTGTITKKLICEYSVGGIKGCSTDNWTIKGNTTRTSKTKKCGNWKYKNVKIIELWGWVTAYASSPDLITKDDTLDHADDYKGHSISPFFVGGKDLWHIHLFHSFSSIDTIHYEWHSA